MGRRAATRTSRRATAVAPWTGCGLVAGPWPPPSVHRVASGASSSIRASRSPPRAAARKAFGHLPVDPRIGPVAPVSATNVLAGAVCQLTDGRRAATEQAGDLVMAESEALVQDEDCAFQWRGGLQQHQQRHREGLGADGGLGTVLGVRDGAQHRVDDGEQQVLRGEAEPQEILASQMRFDNHFVDSPQWTSSRIAAGSPAGPASGAVAAGPEIATSAP